jgi:hypothetical protein
MMETKLARLSLSEMAPVSRTTPALLPSAIGELDIVVRTDHSQGVFLRQGSQKTVGHQIRSKLTAKFVPSLGMGHKHTKPA